MRLLAACLVLFLTPAGALLLSDRHVSELEDEFFQDAKKQTDRLASIYQLYPPRVKRMALAPAILQLRELGDGASVATRVCGAPDSPFRRLFDNLSARCGNWSLARRARWFGLLSVALTTVVFGLILMARITVQRCASRELWPGNWTMWFVMRGVPLLLALQVAVSLSGYGIILQNTTHKMGITLAAMALPFAALLLVERKLVLAFVEPRQLRVFRPRGAPRAEGIEAPAANEAPVTAAPATPAATPTPRLEPRAGIGVARRRRGPDER